MAGARHANLRRTSHMGKLSWLTSAANVLVLGVAVYWLHERLSADFEARLASLHVPSPPPTAPVSQTEMRPDSGVAREDLKKLETPSRRSLRSRWRLSEFGGAEPETGGTSRRTGIFILHRRTRAHGKITALPHRRPIPVFRRRKANSCCLLSATA